MSWKHCTGNALGNSNNCYFDCCFMRMAWRELLGYKGNFRLIVHGPQGCCSDDERTVCTGMQEKEIALGGEDALYRKAAKVLQNNQPEALFIISTCASEMIGDDIASVAKRLEKKFKLPVIAIAGSGFSGGISRDIECIALKAMLKRIPKGKKQDAMSVNYIGDSWPSDSSDAEEISFHLGQMGITLNLALRSGNIKDLTKASNASMSIFLTKEMHDSISPMLKHSIICPYPLGIRGTSLFYYSIAKALGCENQARKLIPKWEKECECAKVLLRGKTIQISTGIDTDRHARLFKELGMKLHSTPNMILTRGVQEYRNYAAQSLKPLSSYKYYSGFNRLAEDLAFLINDRFTKRYGEFL